MVRGDGTLTKVVRAFGVKKHWPGRSEWHWGRVWFFSLNSNTDDRWCMCVFRLKFSTNCRAIKKKKKTKSKRRFT